MKKTKLLCLVLVAIFFVIALSACATEQEHEPITIMDALRDYSGLIELVKEKYPEINIEIVPYRGRNQSAYMKQQLETGILPDIYSSTQAWDGELQKQNLLDLSNYDVTSLYNTARLSKYLVDGSVYLLPFDYTVTGVCCNKSLLDRLDIEVPTSFNQLKNETIPALEAKNVNIAVTQLDLPGSAFNYFFDTTSTTFMNTNAGESWRDAFADTSSDTFASGNDNLTACTEYFQQWIDCGLITYDENVSKSQTSVQTEFDKGNTAFLLGSIKKFWQVVDENGQGSGDQYELLPFLSPDGSSNTYIVTPGRLYGLNKSLGETKNKQKLIDALHVLEVLSSNEGYKAINGTESTNLCSIKDFEPTEGNIYYSEALVALKQGHSMDLVYTGWDNYLEPFGNALLEWVKGNSTATEALKVLDDTKKYVQENGTPYYGIVTEELNTVQAAQLTGQIFMDATGADGALVSYNVYNENIHPNLANSYGANGHILPSKQTKEYITIWLATGWSETIQTVKKTGREIKAMAEQGTDTRNTGFYYPYVYMTKDGKDFEDDKEYTVVLVGHNRSERKTIGLIDTGIVGLEAAMKYLNEVGLISSKTLNNSLVISITPEREQIIEK